MGKTIYIPEDKISLLREYFTRGEIDSLGENFFVFFRDKLFLFSKNDSNFNDIAEELIHSLHNGGLEDYAQYLEYQLSNSPLTFINSVESMLKDVPRILCGNINGNDLHLSNNIYYDVVNSPEFKKLVSSNNFSNIYIGSESGSREKLIYSSNESENTLSERYLPDSLYHGTSLKNAIGVVTKGLRPSPERSNFSKMGIYHSDTVFLCKDVTTACAYSAMYSHSFVTDVNLLPVIIEYDVKKMDGSKFVLDFDLYTSHGNGEDVPYENVINGIDEVDPVRAQRIRVQNKKSETVDVAKNNPLRFNRVGYRGIVMPAAVKKIYVFTGRDYAKMFVPQWTFDNVNDFINSIEEIKEFCMNNDGLDEEKKVLPPYEKDEFEIGDEGGNNEYFHINESFDSSEIGEVVYSWDFDEDSYQDYLSDEGLSDSEEVRMEYIKDCVSFDLEYMDNETFHSCGYDSVDYNQLEDMFGERKAYEIVKYCMTDGGGRFETAELYSEEEFDINNPNELNDAVLKQIRSGEYYKDARGFILSNGKFIYTPNEHNQVTIINGVKDKFQFIRLGNIRVLDHSIDIGKEPTPEQRIVLRQVISCYADDELYLDIFASDGSEVGTKYVKPDWRRVLADVDRYYSEGIKPMGGSMYESKELVNENNSFESWFGNSVIVDANGKPMKMYHGSGDEFEEFKKEFIGRNGAHEGYGFNFTPFEDRARSYNNGNVLEVYLRAEKPMTTKSHNITPRMIAMAIAEIDKGVPYTDTVVAAFETPKYGEKWDERYYRRALSVAAKSIYDYNVESEFGDAGIYADICLCGNGDVNKVIEAFESLGYDSAIFYDSMDRINTVVVFEPNQIKKINNKTYNNGSNLMGENVELELDADEVSLSSFKKNDKLADKLWDGYDLNPKARLRLLDIADDFWETTDVSWVKPKGIILTGSICNFNWSKYSDIDLHLVVDFREVDERKDFVQEYFDGKKNNWNNEHKGLKIYGYPVEIYVEDIDADTQSGGIYDLEENKWIKKPSKNEIEPIGLNKYEIKALVAKYCTKIDDLCDLADSTDDSHVLGEIGKKANKLLNRIKKMRKFGLERSGEGDPFNIAYKCYRRMGYLDKLFDIKSELYDRIKSISESKVIKETVDSNIFDIAKQRFGTTYDIRECGYILPDGSMLDFTGSHQVTGDTSHLKGRRAVDHREISDLNYEVDGNTKTGLNVSMEDFIRSGAIRIHASSSWSNINLYVRPTQQQIDILLRLIRYSKGCVSVEIGDGNESLSYAEYDEARPRKVIADILRYFDEGINLEGEITESKEMLKEYLDKDYNIALYKYFKWANDADDDEKAADLAWNFYGVLVKYLKRLVERGRIDDEEDVSKVESADEYEPEDDSEYEYLISLLKKYGVSSDFESYCYNHIDYYANPAWMYMSFVRVVKNEWCIHFGADSYNIAREGFTGGTENVDDLAYTNAGQEKYGEGYDFAFTINDKDVDFNNYGDEAVIFRTSGVMCYHYGDNQYQVIFWGPYAYDFIPIKYDENEGDWVIEGKNGRILMTGNPSELAAWATENLPQYRKQIMAGKNGYIPKYYSYKDKKMVPYERYRNKGLGEGVLSYIKVLKEEVNARGNASHDVYRPRWHYERESLKRFLQDNGTIMTSKENGKTYYVYYDTMLSNLIGINYCVCLQYDMLSGETGRQVYVRAIDKFTQRMFKPQVDTRGHDNAQTLDDVMSFSEEL